MGKKLNVLCFKFSLALGGGERFNFVLGKKLIERGHRVRFYSNFKPLLKKLNSSGLKARKIYWGREVGARRYLPQFFLLLPINLFRFFFILFFNKKKSFQNVVIFQSLNEKIFATSLASFMGYKVFWIEHLSIHPWLMNSFFKKTYVDKANQVSKIITLSNSVKNELINDLKIPKEKIETVYNGIDLNDFHVLDEKAIENEKKKYGFFKGSRIIGYAGRLHAEKGLNVLVDSFFQLSRRFDHLYLLLAGEGPERKKLEAQVQHLGLDKKVLFLGFKDDMLLFFNLIDIFVLPSVERESFGIVLTEAMACSKVVVASNLGGIPEIINDGIDGFLFEPGNANELVNLLSKLLSDEKLMNEIGLAALTKVKKYFSIDVMINKIEEVFSK